MATDILSCGVTVRPGAAHQIGACDLPTQLRIHKGEVLMFSVLLGFHGLVILSAIIIMIVKSRRNASPAPVAEKAISERTLLKLHRRLASGTSTRNDLVL